MWDPGADVGRWQGNRGFRLAGSDQGYHGVCPPLPLVCTDTRHWDVLTGAEPPWPPGSVATGDGALPSHQEGTLPEGP